MISSRTLKGFLATSFLGAAMSLQGCAQVPVKPAANENTALKTNITDEEQARVFQKVMDGVRRFYIDTDRANDNQNMVDMALKGALQSLDPHSEYLTAKEYAAERQEQSGIYAGAGIELVIDNNGALKIVAPFKNSGAEKAGIREDDIITHVDGRDIGGMKMSEIIGLITGEPKTPVTLTVYHQGATQPENITIIRDTYKADSVKTAAIGKDIAYLQIKTFNTVTVTEDFRNAVATVKKQMGGQPAAYIIDLRGNLGGFVDEALNVTDDLLDGNGAMLSVKGRTPEDSKVYKATPGDVTGGKPIILLVDGGSASASEIMAGALQDNKRAIVLGTQTFGKGSVQKTIPAGIYAPGQEGAFKVTVYLYFTPDERSIQGHGITPNILFVPPEDAKALQYDRESEFPNMIAHPESKRDTTVTTQTCKAAQAKLPEGTKLRKPLLDIRGSPDYALICAVETLRLAPQLTVTEAYVPPAPKPEAR